MKKIQKYILTIVAVLFIQTSGFAQIKPLIELVEIPAGSFYMGSEGKDENFDEAPIHKVNITHAFRIGRTEVTNAQYELFRPEHKKLRGKNNISTEDDDAVVNVSYQDAVDFCKWLSEKEGKTYRLPTEAEWEYACRSGTYTLYYTGDGLSSNMRRNQTIARIYKSVSLKVGQTRPNAFGLYDMHGNVEEWCLDWYGAYSAEEQTNPTGPADGEFRVTRGGSHHTPDEYLRSANRLAMIPEDKHSLTGFRVVQSDEPLMTAAIDLNQPFFMEPLVFVREPVSGSGTPFYRHNHQPSITWCDNGDMLAVWFSANQENGRGMVVLSSRLRKGASEWTPAELFYKVPDRNMTGSSIFNNGKGTMYHFNGVEAAGDWQNLIMIMRTSTDNGFSWSKSQIIAPEHTTRHQIISGTLQTPEGWMVQLCDAGPGSHDGTAVHISKDKGKTWTDPWDGKPIANFKDGGKGTTIAGIHAGLVVLKNGDWMALGRGNSLEDENGRKCMPMSISEDMGKTWEYKRTDFPAIDGGQRLVLIRLNEGPLLLVSFTDHPQRTRMNDRGMIFTDANGNTFKGYGMYAAISYDDGKTWPVKRLLTDGKERHLNGGAWTGFFDMDATHAEPRGYLAGTQSPDNTIHIVSSRIHYRFNLKWLEGKQ